MRGASFEGKLEAIYMGTEYAKDNLSSSNNNLHIYTDSQAAINAIIGQKHNKKYQIKSNEHLPDGRWNKISLLSSTQRYNRQWNSWQPGQSGIKEAKASALKAWNSFCKISKADKGDGKIQKHHKYKQMVPQINSVGIKQRSLQLRLTSRRWSSKMLMRSLHA